eukprot:2913_1
METILLIILSLLLHICYGKGKVGMNLEGHAYYSPGLKYKNRFGEAMPWISSNGTDWSDNTPLDFDGNGYVKSLKQNQIARSLFLDGLTDSNGNVHYQRPGEHIFTYEGDCSGCEFSFNAKVIDKSQQGKWIMNVTGEGLLNIMSIKDPSNYPHNFALVPSQWESINSIWDPDWLKPITDTPFSNLRFMDFLDTNNSPNRYWKDRTMPTNYTMGQQYGIAWEFVIDLCNKLSPIDCWINIPHLADDDYVQNLAEMWYKNYTGKGVIHIEYSNECWNGMFQCFHYMVNQSAKENISEWQWYGQRTCEIRTIWDGVYGDKSATSLYTILGTQEVNSWITNQELLNGNAQCVDGIAVAQYYCTYGLNDTQQLSMTEDQLFDNMESQQTLQHYAKFIEDQMIVANNYTGHNGQKLQVIAYEGSWGCTPDTYQQPMRDNLTTLYDNLVHNQRVTQTVINNVANFHNITGGSLFNMFSYIGFGHQYGDWGHLEFQDSYKNGPGGYKFDGIQKYLGVV